MQINTWARGKFFLARQRGARKRKMRRRDKCFYKVKSCWATPCPTGCGPGEWRQRVQYLRVKLEQLRKCGRVKDLYR